jgi:hypothetical protein
MSNLLSKIILTYLADRQTYVKSTVDIKCDSILTTLYAGQICCSKEYLVRYDPDKRKNAYKSASN